MPAFFEHRITVSVADIDRLGHANNLSYLQWAIDAALAHSTAQGWSTDRYRECGFGWVVRSHTIEYRQPAFEGEALIVRTWVAAMKRFSSLRKYQILRAEDRALLCFAETNWAFINYADGTLRKIEPEVAQSFILATEPDAPGER